MKIVKGVCGGVGAGRTAQSDDRDGERRRTLQALYAKHHEPLAALKLCAYACDAMRVLAAFQQSADMAPALDRTLKSICEDWRNPGTVNEPLGAINDVISAAVRDVQVLIDEVIAVGG